MPLDSKKVFVFFNTKLCPKLVTEYFKNENITLFVFKELEAAVAL